MMHRVFDLHMVFLRMNQSEQTLKHCFGLIRMFIQKVKKTARANFLRLAQHHSESTKNLMSLQFPCWNFEKLW